MKKQNAFGRLIQKWIPAKDREMQSGAQHLVYLVSKYLSEADEDTYGGVQKEFEKHLKDLLSVCPKAIEYACEKRFWNISPACDSMWESLANRVFEGHSKDVIPAVLACALLQPYGFLETYKKVQGEEQYKEDIHSYWSVPSSGWLKKVIEDLAKKHSNTYKVKSLGVLELALWWVQKKDIPKSGDHHIEHLLGQLRDQPRSLGRQAFLKCCAGASHGKRIDAFLEECALEELLPEEQSVPVRKRSL